MLRSFSICVLTVALLSFAPRPASAVIIDSFDDADSVSADSGTTNDTVHSAPGSFLGTDRQLTSLWNSGPNSVDADIDAGGSSQLNISLGADTLGSVFVQWTGIGGVDLTAGGTLNAIGLGIDFNDLPANINIQAEDTSFNFGSLTIPTTGGISSATEVLFEFASFSGSVDFSDISFIQLGVTPSFPATDLQIDFIQSTFVPEPSTALLVGGGLLVLAVRSRRTKA